jgi:serine/threonine-protein kinase
MDPTTPFSPGKVLAGKYQIEHTLGSGGMGFVVAARHMHLGTGVAIKFLRPEACADAPTVTRFLREARAAARLQSEHVARVVDVATLDSGAPYIVMELLRGEDVAHAIARAGPLPVDRAVQFLLEASEAVAEAHALGIIHRDLKPANLFLATRPDGSSYVKVLDFGISKTLVSSEEAASAGAATATGAMFGTPYYMSPEQIRSARSVDARSDVWSLGATLYEMLTARKAFEAESLPAVFVLITNDPPTPPRAHRPDLPPTLEAALLASLEKDPARRVQSVAELAARIAPFAPAGAAGLVERVQRLAGGRREAPAMPSGAPPDDKAAQAATGRAWSGPKAPRSRERAVVAIAVAAVGTVLVASALLVPRWMARRHATSEAGPMATAVGPTQNPVPTPLPSAMPIPTPSPMSSASASPIPSAIPSPSASPGPTSRPRPARGQPSGARKDESSPTLE